MKSDKLLAIAFFLLSILLFSTSYTFPATSLSTGAAGASFFPQVWAIILAVLSGILFFKSKGSLKGTGSWLLVKVRENKKVFYMLFIALIYIFLMDKIGFMITTFLFLLISIYLLDSTKQLSKLKIFSISISISLFTYLTFSKVLKVFLPTGILF